MSPSASGVPPRPDGAAAPADPEAVAQAGERGEALTRAHRWLAVTTSRPVAVLMVFLAVMVFGGFSIRLLPMNLMPDISYPKLTVRTEYAGAAPAEVENAVSRPLEEMLGVVTGLSRIESISRAGYSDVILEFSWDTDMDEAGQDVLEKVDSVRPNLPDGVGQPLILRYDPTLDPVLTLSLGGSDERFEGEEGLVRLRRIADRDVRRLLEPLPGVAAVKIVGGLSEEVQILLDEEELKRTGVGVDTVVARLQAENINLAGGTMRDGRTRYLVRTVNEVTALRDIERIVVTRDRGRDIRIEDLATVRSAWADREVITRVDGEESVEIEIYKEADANIVEMATLVRETLDARVRPTLDKQYDVDIRVASDRSRFIESSIAEVRSTAVVGGLLAVVLLFFFLRDLRSTLIVAISIPVSVLVTFAPLSIAGVSLNIMSLGGLAMGIGMLVDNSIVVLESIHRCRQEGDDVVAATLRGTAEVGSAVTASTLTTIAVFFPMVFVEGVAGQLFGDLGLAVVFSLLASLAVAMFLIPMLASRQELGGAAGQGPQTVLGGLGRTWSGWASASQLVASFRAIRQGPVRVLGLPYVLLRFVLHALFELVGKLVLTSVVVVLAVVLAVVWLLGKVLRVVTLPPLWLFAAVLSVLERAYPPVIRACLHNRALVYLAFFASLAYVGWGLSRLDTELIPELHQGEFTARLELPVGTPLNQTADALAPLEDRVRDEVPGLTALTVTVGNTRDDADNGERGEHTARMRVLTRPEERTDSWLPSRRRAETIEAAALEAVRAVLKDVPDLSVKIERPVLFSFKTPVEVEVRGYELPDLSDATRAVAERMQSIPGLRDVEASIQPGSPEVHVVFDRDGLARLGLDVRRVAELVRDKVQGNEATRMARDDRKVPVRVRLQGIRSATVAELKTLQVNPGGLKPIPLSAVAELVESRGPNEIRRIGQQRVGVVTANLEGAALGGVAKRIADALADLRLPEDVTTAITGQSAEWETSSRSLLFAMALSVFLVYVIMASQFENLLYPLVILITIPLALVGVVTVLWWTGTPVSIVVLLGAIMLAGIVVNNAIVLVDYTGRLKRRGMSTTEALEMAGRVRLRPILMTTLTTMLGLVPMAMGLGDGAEIRAPMALTVIAGLGLSTLLTLLVIPTLYAAIDGLLGGTRLGDRIGDGLDEQLAAVTPEQLAAESEVEALAGRGATQVPPESVADAEPSAGAATLPPDEDPDRDPEEEPPP